LLEANFCRAKTWATSKDLACNWFGTKILAIPPKILARQYFSLLPVANQVPTLVALPRYWTCPNIGIPTFWLALKLAWQKIGANRL
jgi:hypothetical protein